MLENDQTSPVWLPEMAERLQSTAPIPIRRLQARSACPLYLRWSDSLTPDCACEWTPTELALMHVSPRCPDVISAVNSALPLVYVLEQHAFGLPIHFVNGDEVDDACIETTALVRAYDRFVADRQVLPTFLPPQAVNAVDDFHRAIEFRDPAMVSSPRARLGALAAHCGIYTLAQPPSNAEAVMPGLASVVHKIRTSSPENALATVRQWVGRNDAPTCISAHNSGARVIRGRVVALGSIADGVLATTEKNTKGFALTVSQLVSGLTSLKMRRVIGQDHDRSIPPGLVAIGAHLREHGSRHELHVKVAAINERGETLLAKGGGFSPAYHVTDE